MESYVKRPLKVTMRLSEEEKAELERIANSIGCTKSKALRIAWNYFTYKDNGEKLIKRDVGIMKQLCWPLLKLGTNVNQIAHALNIIKNAIDYGDVDDLRYEITRIDEILGILPEIQRELSEHKRLIVEKL